MLASHGQYDHTHSSNAISGAMRSMKSGISSLGLTFSYVALYARYSTNFSVTAALGYQELKEEKTPRRKK